MSDDTAPGTSEPTPASRPKVTRARATTVGKASKPKASKAARSASTDAPAPTRPSAPVAVMDIPAAGDAATSESTAREGGILEARGETIDLSMGGIGLAQATDIAVTKGGIGVARGDRVSVEMGAIGLGLGRETRLTQGIARMLLGQEVRVEQAAVGAVAASTVTIQRTTAVGILIAARVDGVVRPLVDWRGALAFGAAAGLIIGILRRR